MGGYREEEGVEEEPLPTMDWAALERHLAGLQCREQENQNLNHIQNHNMGKTNYTSVSVQGFYMFQCVPVGLLRSSYVCQRLSHIFFLSFPMLWWAAVIQQLFVSDGPWKV